MNALGVGRAVPACLASRQNALSVHKVVRRLASAFATAAQLAFSERVAAESLRTFAVVASREVLADSIGAADGRRTVQTFVHVLALAGRGVSVEASSAGALAGEAGLTVPAVFVRGAGLGSAARTLAVRIAACSARTDAAERAGGVFANGSIAARVVQAFVDVLARLEISDLLESGYASANGLRIFDVALRVREAANELTRV